MVPQAVVGDLQSLISSPFTPSTYQVLARAAGAKASERTISRSFVWFRLIRISMLEFAGLGSDNLVSREDDLKSGAPGRERSENTLSKWL
jgi:hypothetical protein